ncbi:glycoside hydrolase/deacetylase [Meredithblackwellia eburnea MCA 4105]
MSYPEFKKPSKDFISYAPERDFVGYGEDSPKDCWPNGKKIVVSFVLNYEEGAETTIWNGDPASEPTLHELSYQRPVRKGKRDLVVESMFENGIRTGLPRILKLFKKHNMPFTMWCCPRALEHSPSYIPHLIEGGHEFACHGNHWRRHGFFEGPDDDAAHVREGFEKFEKLLGPGKGPSGWYIHAHSLAHKHIRAKVHKEKGIPLLYCSDTYTGDLPYYISNPLFVDGSEKKDEGLLMIPYNLVNNDHRFITPNFAGFGASTDWFDLLKGDFDMLYAEGEEGKPKMMTVAFHQRIIGVPTRVMALKRFMEYISTKADVWVATREDIAKHWRAKYPFEEVGITRNMHY